MIHPRAKGVDFYKFNPYNDKHPKVKSIFIQTFASLQTANEIGNAIKSLSKSMLKFYPRINGVVLYGAQN